MAKAWGGTPIIRAASMAIGAMMTAVAAKATARPDVRTASSAASPVAAMESWERGFYGVQFHPEVVHTPKGTDILKNFLYKACACEPEFTPASIIEEAIAEIRDQVGDNKAILGLSGGMEGRLIHDISEIDPETA